MKYLIILLYFWLISLNSLSQEIRYHKASDVAFGYIIKYELINKWPTNHSNNWTDTLPNHYNAIITVYRLVPKDSLFLPLYSNKIPKKFDTLVICKPFNGIYIDGATFVKPSTYLIIGSHWCTCICMKDMPEKWVQEAERRALKEWQEQIDRQQIEHDNHFKKE